jgi:hypothetical protein
MPRKKRQIRADYRKAGFIERPGKGDHMIYSHPLLRESMSSLARRGKMRCDTMSRTFSEHCALWKMPGSARADGSNHE